DLVSGDELGDDGAGAHRQARKLALRTILALDFAHPALDVLRVALAGPLIRSAIVAGSRQFVDLLLQTFSAFAPPRRVSVPHGFPRRIKSPICARRAVARAVCAATVRSGAGRPVTGGAFAMPAPISGRGVTRSMIARIFAPVTSRSNTVSVERST